MLSPRDLISVSDANRPSIDKVLPTRYSQLELDSQRLSSARQNTEFLLFSPRDGWSSSNLAKRQRQLVTGVAESSQPR